MSNTKVGTGTSGSVVRNKTQEGAEKGVSKIGDIAEQKSKTVSQMSRETQGDTEQIEFEKEPAGGRQITQINGCNLPPSDTYLSTHHTYPHTHTPKPNIQAQPHPSKPDIQALINHPYTPYTPTHILRNMIKQISQPPPHTHKPSQTVTPVKPNTQTSPTYVGNPTLKHIPLTHSIKTEPISPPKPVQKAWRRREPKQNPPTNGPSKTLGKRKNDFMEVDLDADSSGKKLKGAERIQNLPTAEAAMQSRRTL